MIDLAAARETFEASTDLTVGIEEEFALVDTETLELVPRFEDLRDAAATDPVLVDSVAGELISSEIEIRSGPGLDLRDARGRQAERRRLLFALALEHGVALGSTGTHPLSDYREQRIIDTPHYRRVEEGLKYVAWRNNTFSIHVHVGVRGADRAIQVCDRLRPVLPTLLAISASSPFVDGRDSGLHSARTQTFTRSFPRCGVPDAFGSWQGWADYVELLVRTGSIVEFTQLWWSIRPHHSFGTVAVRICDAQITAAESDAMAELMVACVAQAAREVDAGETFAEIPPRLIEENMWRAIRHGQDGRLLDLESPRIEEYPAAEALERLCAWTGVEVSLPELNGAQRQRRLIDAGASPAEVYAECVRATRASYAQLDEETVA
jgi:carboxylate-amine ligase